MSLSIDDSATHPFGQSTVQGDKVYYLTELSVAFVNRAPVQPGHSLVIPKRGAAHLTDLTPEETKDIWLVAAKTAKMISANYQSINPKAPADRPPSFTYAIQDGVDAGQTVKHVHIHILPRIKGDFVRNDEVYESLEKNETHIDQSNQSSTQSTEAETNKPHMDSKRIWLTDKQQVEQAARYRDWIAKIKD